MIVQTNLRVSYEAALVTLDICIDFSVLSHMNDEELL